MKDKSSKTSPKKGEELELEKDKTNKQKQQQKETTRKQTR